MVCVETVVLSKTLLSRRKTQHTLQVCVRFPLPSLFPLFSPVSSTCRCLVFTLSVYMCSRSVCSSCCQMIILSTRLDLFLEVLLPNHVCCYIVIAIIWVRLVGFLLGKEIIGVLVVDFHFHNQLQDEGLCYWKKDSFHSVHEWILLGLSTWFAYGWFLMSYADGGDKVCSL